MRLSVVIPQHSEREDDIRPLLASLDGQIAVDFADIEVCVVNDHSDALLSPAFLSSFLNIRPRYVVRGENGGNGMARQTGIGSTTGEYILFCDADDILYSCRSLSVFFDAMPQQPDYFMSAFYEERRDGGDTLFVKRVIDAEMLHGKMFRRAFLEDAGIRFLPSLRLHCDTYFCHVAYHAASSRPYADHLTYVFRHNRRSLTHSDNGRYYVASYPQYCLALLEQLRYFREHVPGILEDKKAQVKAALQKYIAQPAFAAPGNEEYAISADVACKETLAKVDMI